MAVDKFGRSPKYNYNISNFNVAQNKLNRNGEVMSGNLDMSKNRIINIPYQPDNLNDAVNASFVIQGDVNVEQKSILRNGTQAMTGHLNMDKHYINNVSDSDDPQDVATKNYVDSNKVSKSGDAMTGELNMDGHVIRGLPITYPPEADKDQALSMFQIVKMFEDARNKLIEGLVNKEGGVMTGHLDLGSKHVTNLANPVNNQDAATKKYVDSHTKPLITVWAEQKDH